MTYRPTVNHDTAGIVRYTGYDPEAGECHFSVNLSAWANGALPPLPAARLMDAAPDLLEALEHILDICQRAWASERKDKHPIMYEIATNPAARAAIAKARNA